jgi:hypothetical protein
MSCDENYLCKIEKTRYFFVKETKEIYVDPNSVFSYKYYNKGMLRYRGFNPRSYSHVYDSYLDGLEIFSLPACKIFANFDHKLYDYSCVNYLEEKIRDFEHYKMMPFSGFSIESIASKTNYFIINSLLYLSFPILFALLQLLFKLKKRYNQRKKSERRHLKKLERKQRKHIKINNKYTNGKINDIMNKEKE